MYTFATQEGGGFVLRERLKSNPTTVTLTDPDTYLLILVLT